MEKMRVSPVGLDLIKSFESFSPVEYVCPAGKRTIGYGHVIRPGESFGRIDEEKALELLSDDCGIAETFIDATTPGLTQNEFDALVSFVFNVGVGNYDTSTLKRLLKAGEKAAAANEFLKWDHVHGEVLAGLTRRREAERALFLAED